MEELDAEEFVDGVFAGSCGNGGTGTIMLHGRRSGQESKVYKRVQALTRTDGEYGDSGTP